jgi:hypothetical protein
MANTLLGSFQTTRRGRVAANERSGAIKQPVGHGTTCSCNVLVLVLVLELIVVGTIRPFSIVNRDRPAERMYNRSR